MNEPNVLKRICRCLCTVIILCAVSVVPASAQAPNVTLEAKNVTVKELLRLIEANSPYTFAYADADITPGKRVSVKADNRSIESIIAEVLPEVNVEIKGLKILLTTRSGGGKPAARNAGASRTITGRITDDEGAPVVGAAVILKGFVMLHFSYRWHIRCSSRKSITRIVPPVCVCSSPFMTR